MKRITVLLADDHQIVREGFRALLEHEPDIEVVGEAETGRHAVQLAKKLSPAVIVMDIAMPPLNGLEATQQIRKDFPATKVIILSAHSDEAYAEQAQERGASGFLPKQNSSNDLAVAIRQVQRGNTFFGTAISRRRRGRDQNSLDRTGALKRINHRLSAREIEVLKLVAAGKTNKQMASELTVAFKMVDKHRQNLMRKLDIHDVAGLTRYAISQGISQSSVRVTIV
jgi:DNA-binding NarL/FixJ family response regulator